MARIRTIKPAFFRHRDLFLLEQSSGLPVRLAFAGLWTVADREGRFRWKAEELKLDCLPYDAVNFAEVLAVLETAGFVRKYTVEARDYGWIPSWSEHQKVGPREAQSGLPAPPEQAGSAVTSNCTDGRGKGREEEGKGTEDSSEAHAPSEPPDPLVLQFPVIGGDDPSWRLRRVQVDEWRATFPGVDVVAECRKALGWVLVNQSRRKTARGMPKFLFSWIARSVDSNRAVLETSRQAENVTSIDWHAECQRLHGGRCGGQYKHGIQMDIDRQRTRAAS